MPLIDVPQRSPEWFAARQGKITASLAAAILGVDPHKGPLAAYNAIVLEKKETENKHMAWGVEFEQAAREAYEVASGRFVTETSFWVHELWPWFGASPDGLIGDDGLVEIKCPGTCPEAIPEPHVVQMRVQMAVVGRDWCDYFAWSQNWQFLRLLEREPAVEMEIMTALDVFYHEHILPKVPPPRRRSK